MIETRLTKLLRIRYPIVCGTMHLVTGPEMVAAVANAGALGILYTSARGTFIPKGGIHLAPPMSVWSGEQDENASGGGSRLPTNVG